MAITSTSSVSSSSWYTGKTSSTDSTSSGTTDFLQLLLAQMKAQDPTNAMDSTDMMMQFAQLTTVQELQSLTEKMEALAESNSMSLASSLIGKEVTANYNDDYSIQGLVESVDISDGEYWLSIGGYQVSLSDVTKVSAYEEEE